MESLPSGRLGGTLTGTLLQHSYWVRALYHTCFLQVDHV